MPDLDFFALVLIGGAVVVLAILDKLTWTVADLAHRRLDAVRAELEARIYRDGPDGKASSGRHRGLPTHYDDGGVPVDDDGPDDAWGEHQRR